MNKGKQILSRKDSSLTNYFLSDATLCMSDIGTFPMLIHEYWDGEIYKSFSLVCITKDYIYYCDESEGDENGSTIMLNRNMKLISDNYFAYDSFFDIIAEDKNILWMSKATKQWQKELQQ